MNKLIIMAELSLLLLMMPVVANCSSDISFQSGDGGFLYTYARGSGDNFTLDTDMETSWGKMADTLTVEADFFVFSQNATCDWGIQRVVGIVNGNAGFDQTYDFGTTGTFLSSNGVGFLWSDGIWGDNQFGMGASADCDFNIVQYVSTLDPIARAEVDIIGTGFAFSEATVNLPDPFSPDPFSFDGIEISDLSAQASGTGFLEFYGEAVSSLDVDTFVKIGDSMSVSISMDAQGLGTQPSWISSTYDFNDNLWMEDTFLSAYQGSATIKVVNCYLDK